MTTQFASLFDSRKKIAVVALIIVYIGYNLSQIGADSDFVIYLNNWLIAPLTIGVSALSWYIWRQTISKKGEHLIWLGLAIGWSLWTIAELWWSVASWYGGEVPYPSPADFFWLAGYVPMIYALGRRLRSLPTVSSPARRIALGLILLAVIGALFVLVLWPIILESDLTAFVESVISLLYPIATAVMFILVLQIMFAYQQGRYGRVWQWLTSAFVLLGIVDVVFAYAINSDMYYPEGQVNFVSAIGIDVTYNLAYLLALIGLLQLRGIIKVYQPVAVEAPKLRPAPNTHIYLFQQEGQGVTSFSQNYSGLYDDDNVKGKTIAAALELSPEEEALITKELKAAGVFNEQSFVANTRFGRKEILLSAISYLDGNGDYFGAMILVRVLLDDYSLDDLMIEYHRGMVRLLLKKTDAGEKQQAEVNQLLGVYYSAQLTAFYNHAFAEGGSIFAEALMSEVQSIADKWQIVAQPDRIDVNDLPLSETIKALPALFEAGKQFVSRLSGEGQADAIVQETRANFDEQILNYVSFFVSSKDRYA